MHPAQEHELNQSAFRQMKSVIQATYPPGTFLAISGGKIIAHAAHMEALRTALRQMGRHTPDVLIVEAGVEYPEAVTILFQGSRQ